MSEKKKKPGFSADAVANEFLSIPEAENTISPMKLQKLVYYAHGWHLALANEPLVKEEVQAWPYGPVFPSLYAEFRSYGRDPITSLAVEVKFERGENGKRSLVRYEPRLPEDNSRAKSLVSHIWNTIGHYTGPQLSTLTHRKGTPWHRIASGCENGIPRAVTIPNRLIREYFVSLLKNGANSE